MVYVLALLIGIVAGLRVFTAPALVAWAVHFGWLDLEGTWLAFLGFPAVPWIFTGFALFELIVIDQNPKTKSRKVPTQFATRVLSGALCGAAIGGAVGLGLGVIGAVIGTLGGAVVRERLARRFGKDRPAALLEDAAAVGLAVLAVALL